MNHGREDPATSARGDRATSACVLRAVRGWLLAISSSVLAISAHAAADGGLPNLAMAAGLTVLIGWIATSLADRARGLPGILGTLAVAQVVTHATLTVFSGHHGTGVAIDPAAMTLAHALATVATAILLSHTERGLLLAVASLRRLLPIIWSAPPVRPAAPVPAIAVIDRRVLGDDMHTLLRTACARRGPPAGRPTPRT